jgi:hypothetical protein
MANTNNKKSGSAPKKSSASQTFIKNASNPLKTYTGKYIAGTKIPLNAVKKTVTVHNAKGKTVYNPKARTITTYNSKGKTVVDKNVDSKTAGTTVYNKKGSVRETLNNAYAYDIRNKKGQTIAEDRTGKKGLSITYNKQGMTVNQNKKKVTPTKSPVKSNTVQNFITATSRPSSKPSTKKPTPKPAVKTPAKTPVKTPVSSGPTVSQTWVAKTGTSWSEAKKQGLTDGSAKANLALLEKLKAGTYDKKPAATVTPTPAPTPTPVVTTTTPETKIKPKGTPSGGSGIGAIEREEGMYKRGGSVRKKIMSKKSKRK